MDKFTAEKTITDNILNMYKIYGHENVMYAKYIKSKKLFEFTPEEKVSQNSVLKTKNEILESGDATIATSILSALESNDIEIQRAGASLVQKAPEGEREALSKIVLNKIIEGLNSLDIQIQRIAINMIQFAPEEAREELQQIVFQKILDGLNSSDIEQQRIMAKKISTVPLKLQDNLRELVYEKIVEALQQDDLRVQRLASVMMKYAPSNRQAALINLVKEKFELAKQQGRTKEMVSSPLYRQSPDSKNSLVSHETFSKTGSGTTLLLGEQFKNNVIIRHIEKSCFLSWEKAYESHEAWAKAGFDYVPIEPIYSFNYNNRSKQVDVVSGVLDINLEEWYTFSGGIFKRDLDEQKNKIIETLTTTLGINHGHPNDANFCLHFYRDKKGNVDINKVPRAYLIDFDKAVNL